VAEGESAMTRGSQFRSHSPTNRSLDDVPGTRTAALAARPSADGGQRLAAAGDRANAAQAAAQRPASTATKPMARAEGPPWSAASPSEASAWCCGWMAMAESLSPVLVLKLPSKGKAACAQFFRNFYVSKILIMCID